MLDTVLLKIYLQSWARMAEFCPPHHPENKVRVRRDYKDCGAFFKLCWRIDDLRDTNQAEPYDFQIRCLAPQIRREVERVEREVITPQVHAMLTQMQ